MRCAGLLRRLTAIPQMWMQRQVHTGMRPAPARQGSAACSTALQCSRRLHSALQLGGRCDRSTGAYGGSSGQLPCQQPIRQQGSMAARATASDGSSGRQFAGGRAVERAPGELPNPTPASRPPPQSDLQQQMQQQQNGDRRSDDRQASATDGQLPRGDISQQRDLMQQQPRRQQQQRRQLRRSQLPPAPVARIASAAAAVSAADTRDGRGSTQSSGSSDAGGGASGNFLAAGSSFRSLGIGEALTAALAAAGFPQPSHVQVSNWTPQIHYSLSRFSELCLHCAKLFQMPCRHTTEHCHPQAVVCCCS